MTTQAAIKDAATRLQGAVARITGFLGSSLLLDAAEHLQFAQMLTTLIEAVQADKVNADSAHADVLLADDQLLLALLRLVAFALRGSRQTDLVANCVLALCGNLLQLQARSAWDARTQLGFARKLLRMDTLQCFSRAFSEGAAALAAMPAGGEDGGAAGADGSPAGASDVGAVAQAAPAAGSQPCTDQPDAANARLDIVCVMVHGMLVLATSDNTAEIVFTARQAQQFKELQLLYARELAAALRDSRMLEHGARWALHVQLAEAAGWVAGADAKAAHEAFVAHLWIVSEGDAAVTSALRGVLSWPCVRHLALSMGLAALCAVDGGPSHGLPPALLLRPPVLGGGGEGLRGGHGPLQVESWAFTAMLQVLEDSTAASATPPRNWRTVVGLLRRLSSFLLASARAWAVEEAAAVEAGPQPSRPQLVLRKADIMIVAVPLLELFRYLVSARSQAAGADTSAALADAEAAWWRLVVGVATDCVQWAVAGALDPLAELLSAAWDPLPDDSAGLPPAAAPRAVAAALAGGLLPLWERLLRRAGRKPGGPEATLLVRMLGDAESPERILDLLAYGDQQQAAALVATWGKLLRTLAVPQLLARVGEGGPGADMPRTALAFRLAMSAMSMLGSAVVRLSRVGRHAAATAAAAAAEACAPQLQLRRLLSYVAREWLPPMARLAREGLPEQQRAEVSRQLDPLGRSPQPAIPAMPAALNVMVWLMVLVRLCEFEAAAAAAQVVGEGVAAAPASAAGPTAVPAASGWRQLLLHEAGGVALLGVTCQHLLWEGDSADDVTTPSSWPLLLCSCCLMAAACPGEVRQAVLAAAAEATAAGAGSGGGRGRSGGAGAGIGRQRGGRGGSGRGGGAGRSHAAAPLLPGWSPQLFRFIEAGLRSRRTDGVEGAELLAAALARQAERWVAGGGEDAAELARVVSSLGPLMDAAAAARALVFPAEARALLRTCANPACDNLAGDSEADLPLRACGRCGGAWYCRQECQAAHWRSGHREACAGRSRAVAGTEGPG